MAEEIKEIDDFSYVVGDNGVLGIFVHSEELGEFLVAEISNCEDKLDGECNDLALTVLQEMGYRFKNGKKEK